MPSRDAIHDIVKNALIKDGWTITHDPFFLRVGEMRTYADLGAERPFAAQKGIHKILIEVKSFVGRSVVYDLEQAVGQYGIYKSLLTEIEPDRDIYLAISTTIYASLFDTKAGQVIMRELKIALCIIDLQLQEVMQWIK
jgi:hypothetical protein